MTQSDHLQRSGQDFADGLGRTADLDGVVASQVSKNGNLAI